MTNLCPVCKEKMYEYRILNTNPIYEKLRRLPTDKHTKDGVVKSYYFKYKCLCGFEEDNESIKRSNEIIYL